MFWFLNLISLLFLPSFIDGTCLFSLSCWTLQYSSIFTIVILFINSKSQNDYYVTAFMLVLTYKQLMISWYPLLVVFCHLRTFTLFIPKSYLATVTTRLWAVTVPWINSSLLPWKVFVKSKFQKLKLLVFGLNKFFRLKRPTQFVSTVFCRSYH